jgi:tight adherence protein B
MGMLNLILVSLFITMSVIFYLPAKALIKQKSISRLKRYINVEEIHEEKRKNNKKDLKSSLSFFSKGIENVRFLDGYKKKIQTQLTRAHLLLKPEEFIALCLILFFAAVLFVLLLKGLQNWPISFIAGLTGWFLPGIILKSKMKKRVKNLNDQLGDTVALISNSLKAGYSFFQAIDMVAKEMTGPIAEEFSLLQKEINLGLTTEKALENLTIRVSSDDLELVITAVMIQRQTGGNLAEVLDNISTTIRDRVKIKGEIKTVTAQGRLSGWVISLLPLILAVMVFFINPEHISVMFTNPLGILMLAVSLLMELIGIILINKIVKIEV